MAVTPVNIIRVTNNLRTDFVTESLRRNQLDVFRSQTQISSGRTFVKPSDDPVAASRASVLGRENEQQSQLLKNIEFADQVLTSTDSTISEITSLLVEARAIASQNVSNLTSPDERAAESELIAGIRNQLMDVGNRQFNGRYIFAGRDTQDPPFVDALGGIAYVGDTGDVETRIDPGRTAVVNVPGNMLFGALTAEIPGSTQLTPRLDAEVRLDDLAGATLNGIRKGTLVFNEAGGAGRFTVDLTSADTAGNVVQFINDASAAAGSTMTAALTDTGITITPGAAALTVTDVNQGVVAADLGLLTRDPTTEDIVGKPLGTRLSRLTRVEDLAGGAGIDLDSGFTVTNGPQTAAIDLGQAETVQDIINAINNAGVMVKARINDAGTGLDVVNLVSGTQLSIGELGGTTAADLGVRTFDTSTPLSSLNDGTGVDRIEGETDIAITGKDGSTFEVNLDDAETIGDVIDLINAAATDAAVDVTASLATSGNGILITDETGGSGDLVIGRANLSEAADDLGLAGNTSGDDTELQGSDVGQLRTNGILDALLQLERALKQDDTSGVTVAAQRLEVLAANVVRTHGQVGSKSSSIAGKLDQMRDASITTKIMLSDVEDLDFAEAVTNLQAAQVQLQADLQTSSTLLNMSLLDYLG